MIIAIPVKNTQGCVYNHIRRSYLRPGDEQRFCPLCKGIGEGDLKITEGQYFGSLVCSKCFGKGTIDWIKKLR
jgi:DnaJ-class molecular chaperone